MTKGNTEVTELGSLFGFISPETQAQSWVQNREGESSNFSTDTDYTVETLVIKLNFKLTNLYSLNRRSGLLLTLTLLL